MVGKSAPLLLACCLAPLGFLMAADIPLGVQNPAATALSAEPITSGVPFAQGTLPDAGAVRVLNASGSEIPAQFLTTARWPDGSVRWLLCDFQTDVPGGGAAAVTLQTGTAPAPFSGIQLDDQAATLSANTGAATFTFTKSALQVVGNSFTARYGGSDYTATPSSWTVEENGPMKVVVRVDGDWRRGGALLRDDLIRFRARLFFYYNKAYVRVALTFRNNNSFGWDGGMNKEPDLNVAALSFGPLSPLPAPGPYVFGSGVEKTLNFVVASSGTPTAAETRYDATGHVASGYLPDRPIALAPPAQYAAARAWGRFSLPVTGLDADSQVDFDRFEKLHRSMVIQADVEDPVNTEGITVWQHLAQDIASWHDYGDQRWAGNGAGWWSSNHYDWVYSSYLHAARTGHVEFANLARVMARHEIDMDNYHTTNDGNAYNQQRDWEERPSHDSSDNSFGPGRPTHTWAQGYALHWLMTGDPRGRDAHEELLNGLRLYIYESFNPDGYCNTNEIRLQGWIVDNLLTQWRLDPTTTWTVSTTSGGTRTRTMPEAARDVLQNVFDREAAAGKHGYVYAGDEGDPDPNLRFVLQHCYFIEPAAKAYEEMFSVGSDAAYAAELLALVKRMTRYVNSTTYGGETEGGTYRPLQIPYIVDLSHPNERDGQVPYLLMAANASAFCHLNGGEADFLPAARRYFHDYMRYFGVAGPNQYIDPALRTPTAYNNNVYGGSNVNDGTCSKIQGWAGRFGNFLLAAIQPTPSSYHVNFSAGTGGTLSGAAAQTVAAGGDCTAVTAVPDSGYRFARWSLAGAFLSVDNPLTIRGVSADMAPRAEFMAVRAFHSADYNGDWKIDVFELLRIVTLFNNGLWYQVDAAGVDGYAPSSSLRDFAAGTRHNSDYDPADGKISVFELLRAVTLFNNGLWYQPDPSSADHFAPSPTPPTD